MPTLLQMRPLVADLDVCTAYLDLRHRVIDLLDGLDDDDADRPVPSCPRWSVRDLVAHVVGVPEDILSGNMDGVTTDAWTQAQVDRHAHQSIGELRACLAGLAEPFDPVLSIIPAPVNSQFVMDAVTHEHDLREAIGRPGAHDSEAVGVAAAWLLARPQITDELHERLTETMRADISQFVLMRALSGRMSIHAMDDIGLPGTEIAAALAGSPLSPPPR